MPEAVRTEEPEMPEPRANEGGLAREVAEAEVKLEVGAEAFAALPGQLQALGLRAGEEERIVDRYLWFRASPNGGFDFRRAREIDGRSFVLTEKRWALDAAGRPVRLEDERLLSPAEFGQLIQEAPSCPSLRKRRWDFRGRVDGLSAVVSLDRLELRGQTRWFLECEVLSPPELAADTRERLLSWLRASLPLADATEAPTMLELLLAAEGADSHQSANRRQTGVGV
jgi:hypothetical protein